MWNRFPPTRASSWSAWKSPTWTISTASRPPSLSGRKTPRAIPAPRWPLPPNASIFCACSTPAWARRSAPPAARASARTRWMKWRRAFSTQPEGSRWYALFPCGQHPSSDALARSPLRTAQEGLQPAVPGRAPLRVFHSRIAAGYRFQQAGLHAGGPPGDRAGTAPAAGRYHRDLLPRGRRSDLRKRVRRRAAALQRALSVQDLRHGVQHTGADPVQLQLARGRVPALPGLRQHHRFRHEPRDSRLPRSPWTKAPWTRGPSRSTAPGWAISKSTAATVRTNVPVCDLTAAERETLDEFIRRFFDHLESKKYKMHVRVFLSRYRGYALCPECKGARLRKEALYVRVNGKNLADIVRMNIAEAQEFFQSPGTQPGRDRDRREDPGGDPPAPEVPQRCGAGISHAGSPGEHALGRRGAAHPTGHLAGLAPGGRLLRAGRALHRAAQPRYRDA